MNCPNCCTEHGIVDACFLGMLLGVVKDRHGELTDEQLTAVAEGIDVDYLWERFGGPAADYVEAFALNREKP